MMPKPGHRGLNAEQFRDPGLVEVYHYRRPYPDEAINKLVALITDEPHAVLDVGCGTGDLARRLVNHAERVDASEFCKLNSIIHITPVSFAQRPLPLPSSLPPRAAGQRFWLLPRAGRASGRRGGT